MPSTSKKQHNLMAMVADDPKAAKRLGIPQKVGRDYVEADKGRKFGSGGTMKESKSMMKKELSFMKKKGAPKSMIRHEEAEMEGKGKKMPKFAAGGTSYADRMAAMRSQSDAATAASRQARDAGNAPNAKVAAMRASLDAKIAANRQATDAKEAARRAAAQGARRSAPIPPIPSGGTLPNLPSPGRGAPVAAPVGLPDNTQAMMKKGGKVHKYARGGGIESKGKTEGKVIKMAEGGRYAPPSNAMVMSQVASQQKALTNKAPGMGLQKRQFGAGPGQTPMPKHLGKPISRAGGGGVGSASKRADGCATKGKTKGRMV